jgi:hypothetical protein
MPYLIAKDLNKQIQGENLNQVIGGDSSILSAAELTAIEEAKSYLVQRYDTSQEFKDLNEWSKSSIYKPTDRVYLNATAYSLKTYAVGDLALQAGSVYKCTTAITTAEAFNPVKWALLGLQYDIFYAVYPKPLFNFDGMYAVGDQVYWEGKIYACKIQTQPYSQTTLLQYREIDNVPSLNIVPNNVNNGAIYWGFLSDYEVPVDTDILNPTYWAKGDNRSQQLLTTVVDIALYHVHSRISPRNIPDLRVKRYDDARNWLKMASRGEITASIPMLQPTKGGRIRYGGGIKQINTY